MPTIAGSSMIASTPFAGFDQVDDLSQIETQLIRVILSVLDRRQTIGGDADVDEFLVQEYAARSLSVMSAYRLPCLSDQGHDIQAIITYNLAVSDAYRITARLFELFPSFLPTELPEGISRDTIINTMQVVARLLRTASCITTDEMIGPLISACINYHQLGLLSKSDDSFPDAPLCEETEVIDLVHDQRSLMEDRVDEDQTKLTGRKLAHCATALRFAINGPMLQTCTLIANLVKQLPKFCTDRSEDYRKKIEDMNNTAQSIMRTILPSLVSFERWYL